METIAEPVQLFFIRYRSAQEQLENRDDFFVTIMDGVKHQTREF